MDQIETPTANAPVKESVLIGTIGAFLFSLVGGALYLLLSRIGYIAAVSGLVGVVCAIRGYSFFAKKESKRGIIISVIVAAVVLILAWYLSFCMDLVGAYEEWYMAGEVDYAPTLFEYLPYGVYDLSVNPAYFVDLAISLALAALGCWRSIADAIKRQKAAASAQPVEAAADVQAAAAAAQPAEEPQSPEW